jgi:hypothetical protein
LAHGTPAYCLPGSEVIRPVWPRFGHCQVASDFLANRERMLFHLLNEPP